MTLISINSQGRHNRGNQAVVYRLNLAKSYALLEEKVKAYNDQQIDKKTKIKGVHHSLAKKLLELYMRCFWEWQAKQNFSFTPHTPLPYLSINNVTLADWMTCTDRSIRTYRQKLAELGFILDTIGHGPNKNFEIRLNPAFLWLVVNTHTNRVLLPDVQIFPQTSSGYPERELTGTVSGKKLEPEMAVGDVAMVPEQQEPMNWNESPENHAPVGATGTPTGTPPSCAAPPAPAAENPVQRRAGRILIKYSLPLLFPKKHYWTPQERGRMEAQAARLFQGITEEKLNKIMDNYCLRVLMAAHHYARFTGAPIPHPELFFNPDQPAGFVLTRNWPQYPEQFPIIRRNKPAPKVRTSAGAGTGQVQIGQLFNFIVQ
jgi:hypothetical protein